MFEKRKHTRLHSRMLMTTFWRYNENNIEPECTVTSEDISAEGLRIIYPQQLSQGAVIKGNLFLFSDPIPVSVQGRIVWSRKISEMRDAFRDKGEMDHGFYCAGMHLININSFERKRILRWINKELAMMKV